MPLIYDNFKGDFVRSEIVPMKKRQIPLKKNGWNFNWKSAYQSEGDAYVIYVDSVTVEGALFLKHEDGMTIMDLLEVAPHNYGKDKRYDHVAGCLIAHACKESFKKEGGYKGYLVFVSKTSLMKLYMEKYGAEIAVGQRMFISPEQGEQLIDKYLFREI
jgi:hypothetical protein